MSRIDNAGKSGNDTPGEVAQPEDRRAGGTAGNGSYTDQYQRDRQVPDLDAGAPELRVHDMRRLNRRAIGFLVAIVLLLLVLAFLLLRTATHPTPPPKPRAETVVVPQPPQLLQQPFGAKPAARASLPPAVPAAPALPTLPLQVLPPTPPSKAALPQGPSLLERRVMAAQRGEQFNGAGATRGDPEVGGSAVLNKYGSATSAAPIVKTSTLLLQGTMIRCVLQTRIISDIPGFASCVVTDPVYSFDGQHMLLPKGSKVFGHYDSGPIGSRIAVVWNRIVTPTGIDVNMASPGVDNLGGSGLPGSLDSHWRSRIGAALLISLMSDAFLYEGEKHGPRTDNISPSGGFVVQSPFQSNTAQTLQDLSRQAVQSSANRRATLTINQGSVISIYVARDVDFSGVVARL